MAVTKTCLQSWANGRNDAWNKIKREAMTFLKLCR